MDCQQPTDKPITADVCRAEDSQSSLNGFEILMAQVPNRQARQAETSPQCFDDLTPAARKNVEDAYHKLHKDTPPIGDACMDKNETIHLRLRRSGNMHADAQLTYKKGTEFYDEVMKHLGGLKPGEVKLVAPWPDVNENSSKSPVKHPAQGDKPADKKRG